MNIQHSNLFFFRREPALVLNLAIEAVIKRKYREERMKKSQQLNI